MSSPPCTFVDVCRAHAQERGERPAYIFSDGERERARVSFAQLDLAARRLALRLTARGLSGERVLLLFDAGTDFIEAFFACLYAGAVAVPLNLPTRKNRVEKIQTIARDSGARLTLTTDELADALAKEGCTLPCESLSRLRECPGAEPSSWRAPGLTGQSPAFLQYTSGSTGLPKGVIVSHANLLANETMVERAFAHDAQTVFAGWLPLFHDMGLVGNVLHPMYLGVTSVLMPPAAFTLTPARWLRLISQYRATTSGAPNFAYELCTRRVSEADLADLDLSSWRVAFNGAEPIQASTLDGFATKFARCGFRREAFYPCYGMAEATLFISGGEASRAPEVFRAESRDLEEGRATRAQVPRGKERTLVSCGQSWLDSELKIVDPETRTACPPQQVGEIWVRGPHVAQGYWNNKEASEETFRAHTSDGEGPYLRTGDLGFVSGGQLFVTGRSKDVLIVAGKNHYPQDLERTVAASHGAFSGRAGAALSIGSAGRDELAIVQEVARDLQKTANGVELRRRIREAVLEEHGLFVKRVALIKQHALPMTTSGKVQRALCRKLLLSGALEEVLQEPSVDSALAEE